MEACPGREVWREIILIMGRIILTVDKEKIEKLKVKSKPRYTHDPSKFKT
mgnify:CR=1 FL=1